MGMNIKSQQIYFVINLVSRICIDALHLKTPPHTNSVLVVITCLFNLFLSLSTTPPHYANKSIIFNDLLDYFSLICGLSMVTSHHGLTVDVSNKSISFTIIPLISFVGGLEPCNTLIKICDMRHLVAPLYFH